MAIISREPPNTPTPPETLRDEGNCYKCIPNGLQAPVMIALLQQIAGTNYTAAELTSLGNCYKCIPTGLQSPVIISLLDQIVQGL